MMDLPTHQDNSDPPGTAAKKRPLPVDEAGGSDSPTINGDYRGLSNKRPYTASRPPSRQLQGVQYGGFIPIPVDHLLSDPESAPQATGPSLLEGPIDLGTLDVSETWQMPGTGTQTTFGIDFSEPVSEWDMYSDIEINNQQPFPDDSFQLIQAPSVENYDCLGSYGNADFQPVLDPTGLWQLEDSCLLSGVVSQGNFDGMGVELNMDLPVMDATDTRESSAFQIDRGTWADNVVTTETTTVSTTPQVAEGEKESGRGNDDMNEARRDTCFGMIILDTIQIRDDFMKQFNAGGKKVLLDGYSHLIIIRDPESKSYGGLITESHVDPLWKLITDTNITLSATLKSTTVLEIVVYGCRPNADEIGGMLLDHDCYLQQPDCFDESMAYFNPQCLTRADDDDSMPIWEQQGAGLGTPAASLSATKKSKVAELLDAASGPTMFKDVQVSEMLQTKLKEHQRKALAMMVEKESGTLRNTDFPSIWTEDATDSTGTLRFLNTITGSRVYRKPKLCLGGLIADDMGLGKTLTALALIAGSATTHTNEHQTETRATTLVIAPLSTLTGWQDQIERHLKPGALRFIVYHGPQRQKNVDLLSSVDVVLATYETVRTEYSQALQVGGAQSVVHAVPWTRVVLDEAHVIQNRSSMKFQAIHALKAKHRWCLTGTPIQNRLEDLGSLVEFLRAHPFDDPTAFRQVFLNPISQQQASGWERLRALISGISLRRTKEALENELALPAKQEIVCKVTLDEEERRAYSLVKRRFALAIDAGGNRMSTFQLILRLRQICDHGIALLPADLQEWIQQASRFGSQIPLPAETCLSCGRIPEDDMDDDILLEALSCSHQVCLPCRFVAKSNCQGSVEGPSCPICRSDGLSGQEEEKIQLQSLEGSDSPPYRPSSKVRELLRNLNHDQQQARAAGVPAEKSVIFSIWTGMLDMIGIALTAGGLMFQRLDGTKTHDQRRDAMRHFKTDENCNVLVASIGSAAVGLDLTMASRVHIIEPGWNPMLEQQALQRVHRLGQTRSVKQIRYIVDGADSVERYILQRQQWKLALVDASLNGSTGTQDKIKCFQLLEDMRIELGIDAAL